MSPSHALGPNGRRTTGLGAPPARSPARVSNVRPASVWIVATMACLAAVPAATAERVDAALSVHAVVRPHVHLDAVEGEA